MNKKLLILLALALVVVLSVTACGRTTTMGEITPLAPQVAHPIDVRFENCNACHVADQLAAKPLPHTGMGYTNADCTMVGCHAAQGTTTTTPTTTTTANTSTTQSTTTSAGTTTTTSTTSSTPAGNPIPTTGMKITTHSAAVLASYNGLCLMCHGQGTGVSQYPLPPSYTSRSLSPGTVYVVEPGVPGDHTGRTNDQCLTCH
jgi:hypothetical protein